MPEKGNRFGFVIAGLLIGILIAAMDNTIVATAMGTIVADLGGLNQFVWVTSAYMIAAMAGMPIFGKLSDMFGRKRFFIFGLVVFMIGSALCGTAQTILQLSLYRVIQGIGGGALMPIAFTIVFDLFPPEKRGKITGLFGAVFGISNLFGPLLGAYITDHIHWTWNFYINLPLGIVALVFVVFAYKESSVHTKQAIDWWGAATLVLSVVSLMFALEFGGRQFAWDSAVIISLFSAFAILLIAFLYIETRASEPIISYQMFKNRLYAVSNAVGFFYGAAFIAATYYIPIFVQGVIGGSATNSGLILLPMTLGSVIGAQIGGILANKFSFRNIMIVSGVLLFVGVGMLCTLSPDSAKSMLVLYMILVGLGVGPSFSVLTMAVIHHFDFRQRGSANSTFTFIRSLGMTIGITVFGIIQRNIMTAQLSSALPANAANGNLLHDPREMLDPATRAKIPGAILDKITDALSISISHTFIWGFLAAVLAFLLIMIMGNDRIGRREKSGSPA
ncbi:MAG TPA: MDR family MFS transporter [Bacilli bacterium]